MAKLVFDQSARIGAWVAEITGQSSSWGSFYAMGVMSGEDILAGVVVNNHNGANATCHIAVVKQTKMIVSLFQAVCDYAFRHCKLKRLTGMVPTNEPAVIAFDKHLGFEEEFVMKDGAPGADMMVLVMWHDKCRWLPKE